CDVCAPGRWTSARVWRLHPVARMPNACRNLLPPCVRPNASCPMTDFSAFPDVRGHFGPYGGRFVSETLMHALQELEAAYDRFRDDAMFRVEFDADMAHYVGRPSPLYFA